MTFQMIWGAASYLLALLVAVFLVSWKIERRSYYALRLILCVFVIFGYKFGFDAVLRSMTISSSLRLLLFTLDSFMLYCLSMAAVGVCCRCDLWAMMFCSTAGYCMQHMSQRTYLFISDFLLTGLNMYWSAALLTVITAAYYIVLYRSLIRSADYRGTMLDSKIQISVSFIAVAITIFLNSFAFRASMDNAEAQAYIMIFSALAAVLVFFVEFGWLAAKKAEIENGILQQMSDSDRQQYLIEKDIIDLMNIKCHDLKHQIAGLQGQVSEKELNDLNHTINIYDSIYKTGNHALDVTLTRKALLCEKKNIVMTCILDGHRLDFLSEEDVYSLFSNLLDNAIEAVDQIEDGPKRIISVTMRTTGSAVIIHEENYMSAVPQFVDGLPHTTKQDDHYHGFGTRSIRMVCEKHQGICNMSASGDIFEVDIVFPSVSGEAA